MEQTTSRYEAFHGRKPDGAPASDVNPRFANYARSQGRQPVDQLAHDRKEYPGGPMAGFVVWNSKRLIEFRAVRPDAFVIGGALVDHAAYDAWLTAYVDAKRRDILLDRIAAFRAVCEASGSTDTGDAWEILNAIEDHMKGEG